MKKKHVIIAVTSTFLLISLPRVVTGQIKIRVKPFVGAGLSVSQAYNPPVITINDAFDQLYYDRNLKSAPGLTLRGQARVNLIHIYNLSIGYQFWGHKYRYTDDPPNNQIKVYDVYPNLNVYSLHTPTIQWTLNYRYISSKHVIPFILAGYGPFHGSAKSQYYEWKDTEQTVFGKVVTRSEKWSGNGFVIGAGATVFRYAYFYIGWVELLDDTLPQYQFIDCTIGFTF